MKTFVMLLPSFIFVLAIATMFGFMEKDKIMDKFVREKFTFTEAIEGLKKGNIIHRSGSKRTYVKREITCKGKSIVEYGFGYMGDDSFLEGISFRFEDVLADDWIIEEEKKSG